MTQATPVQVLLSLGLHDAEVARRLQVSRMTLSRWRHGRCQPMIRHQRTALAFLKELQVKILDIISQAAFSSAA